MNDLKNGTVILEKTKFEFFKFHTYISALIRFFDRSKFNHVAICLHIDGEPFVFEAWKCVRPMRLEHWLREKNNYEYIPPAENFDFSYAYWQAKNLMGWTEYNYLGTLFFQLIYQISGKWIGPTGDRANKRVQCAQFVAILLKYPNPWLTSPRNFKPKQ